MNRLKEIEKYYAEEHNFKKEIAVLRTIATKTTATYKWNSPVYTCNGKNVFWISRFKNHFSIGFFNGIFLKDPLNVLINVQKGKTQAIRHWKFKSNAAINESEIYSYLKEALENQRKRLILKPKEKTKKQLPAELAYALNANKKASTAFNNLTLSKQNEYATYITSAKQEKTKLTRLSKILPMLIEGKGLNDKYIK